MSVVDTVRRRYTTKHYNPKKRISAADFASLLEVLRLAPTSVNAQATKYFIADTPEGKAKIAPAFWDFNQPRVTEASHVVVFAVPDTVSDAHLKEVLEKEDADGRFPNAELKAQQDAGRRHCVELFSQIPGGTLTWTSRQAYIAMGFLLFAAAEMGIDATPFEGLDTAQLDGILGLRAKGLKSVCAVSLGYRADNDGNAARPKSRLAADRVFTHI